MEVWVELVEVVAVGDSGGSGPYGGRRGTYPGEDGRRGMKPGDGGLRGAGRLRGGSGA